MSVMMTKRKADAIKSAERDEIYIGEEAAMARVMEAEFPEVQEQFRRLKRELGSDGYKRYMARLRGGD